MSPRVCASIKCLLTHPVFFLKKDLRLMNVCQYYLFHPYMSTLSNVFVKHSTQGRYTFCSSHSAKPFADCCLFVFMGVCVFLIDSWELFRGDAVRCRALPSEHTGLLLVSSTAEKKNSQYWGYECPQHVCYQILPIHVKRHFPSHVFFLVCRECLCNSNLIW